MFMNREFLSLWSSIFVLVILIAIIGFSIGMTVAFVQYWLFI